MLMRRIREHVTAHNWFAVGIDLVIVVLGVFLGTQVSNWNAERLAHEAGDSYRARIVRDLENNQSDLQSREAYFTQVRAFALQVLGDLDGSARLSEEQFLIAAYQATQIYPRPLTRGSYDEIQSVGALDTLGSVSTRDNIANYYVAVETSEATFRNVPPYREIVRRAIPYHVQARIREACAEEMITATTGLARLTLPESCTLALDRSDLAQAAARVRATPGLEYDVTRLLADLDQKLIQTERSQTRAASLADELSER
ncbi:MAG: hypothetical protein DCF16_03990 [Alphaproteobacteria bacterium]|nr:MAG: hypothetical protein DCF16_03990 [Alphaproteobacteria bacterium]